MSFFENGFTGVKQLFAAIFRFKFPIKYWLATLFLLPSVWAIVFFAFGREATDPDVTGLAYITILISPLNALLGIFSGIGPIGEEIGWRGYLLEKMLQKFSVIKTNTILGLIWAFWHLPLIIFLPEFRDDISIGLFLLLYPLLAILLTTMMTNFWKWTNGSIFIAIWVHSIVNELLTYGGNGIWLEDYSTIQLNLISLVIFGLVALISSLVFRKKGESH
jgi:membrane protease YdiL (CAAX protease family)